MVVDESKLMSRPLQAGQFIAAGGAAGAAYSCEHSGPSWRASTRRRASLSSPQGIPPCLQLDGRAEQGAWRPRRRPAAATARRCPPPCMAVWFDVQGVDHCVCRHPRL